MSVASAHESILALLFAKCHRSFTAPDVAPYFTQERPITEAHVRAAADALNLLWQRNLVIVVTTKTWPSYTIAPLGVEEVKNLVMRLAFPGGR